MNFFRKKLLQQPDVPEPVGAQQRTVITLNNEKEGIDRIQFTTVPIRPLQDEEVLVKVEASPIHITDALLVGGAPGQGLGSEGCGRVIAKGTGLTAWRMVGKRVAFISRLEGCWTDYAIVHASDCTLIEETMPTTVAAVASINPLTTLMFLTIAQDHKARAIINTCGSGALGAMLVRCGKRVGLDVISIVRSTNHKRRLEAAGAVCVFEETAENLDEKLRQVCERLKCVVAFDGKGGSFTSRLLNLMPPNSHVYVYAALDGPLTGHIPSHALIAQNKQLHGFSLSARMSKAGTMTMMGLRKKAISLVTSLLETHVREVYGWEQAGDALASYVSSMSLGKTLLMMDAPPQSSGFMHLPTPPAASPHEGETSMQHVSPLSAAMSDLVTHTFRSRAHDMTLVLMRQAAIDHWENKFPGSEPSLLFADDNTDADGFAAVNLTRWIRFWERVVESGADEETAIGEMNALHDGSSPVLVQ
eukprot:c16194_g2_i1.p1 GENE.c16194_g2_i1~~c16194_g2_i1.p1  ORF type:complete len:474 (+),score=96.77 c16194_g2_i1:36-1457(+)